MKRIILSVVVLASIASCTWWQTNKGKINCAAITTVQNAPALITIVTECAAIAVSSAAILPCIEAAAGSQWASDVVACFSADAAGIVSCPAAKTVTLKASPMSADAQANLRAAVQAKYGSQLSP